MGKMRMRDIVAQTEKKIDKDKAIRFFKHLIRKDEIKDLDMPQINMPKTLPTLISVGYSSSSDSSDTDTSRPKTLPTLISVGDSSSSDSSSSNSSSSDSSDSIATADTDTSSFCSESSNSSTIKEWSEVFGEDGRLCFDQVLSCFPSSDDDLTKGERIAYSQTLVFAHYALSSYNEKHDNEFELVFPMMSLVFVCVAPSNDLIHVNFLAKPKNSDSSPDLFFAELWACGPLANEVIRCCILTPRPKPVTMTRDDVYIWHPPGEEECKPCNVK